MEMFKKIMLFCTFIFLLAVVNGCEKAPADNKEEGNANRIDLQSEKLVSIEEAKEQLSSLQGKKVNNFVFPEYIDMPDIDEISVVKLSTWSSEHNDLFVLEEMLNSMWSDYKMVDWTSIDEQRFTVETNEDYLAIQKEDAETGYLYSFDTDGFFCGDSLNDTELMVSSCVKEYSFEWGDSASKEDIYKLVDGEISIYEAVTCTEALFNGNLTELEENQFDYKVQHLYVMESEASGYYEFNMVIGRVYKNLNVNTSSDFYLTEGKAYDKLHCGAHFITIMRHKNKLDYVNICNELFGIEAEVDYQEIISPLWAVQQMDKQVAHIDGMDFDRCGLLYVLVQDNRYYNDDKQDVYQSVNDTTYLRPVWLFAKSSNGFGFDTLTNDNYGVCIMVDAIDGTLYYYEGSINY